MTPRSQCPGRRNGCIRRTGIVASHPRILDLRKANTHSTWTVTIPKSIASGEYILRHEILGLQRAAKSGLAQFYPGCHQVTITGGGTASPKGVALPGAYALNDPGVSYRRLCWCRWIANTLG